MDSTIGEFYAAAAADGPAVGVITGESSTAGTDAAVRRIDGRAAADLPGLYTAVAQAWDFPDHFGRNKDAFDDCLLDLDPRLFTATGTPATGYLTVVENAHALLAEAADADFDWFAGSIGYYRDDYRDRRPAGDRRGFAVLLVTDPAHRSEVTARWAAAGVPVSVLEVS
ncbi:barstar family protein [Gordonia sp. VNK21]|uniref:barstar family protein n=1 Tax=Gordonia sp. VNK21 TaxID=3382483 RepID=UPI0038D4ABEE